MLGARARARAHARLLRSPCSLGRSYCRKSPVCLLLSLMAAKSSLARARVFVEFLLCLWWLSRVRVRGHARAPACVIPCSSGVVGLVVYHRLCVQTVVTCSRSCRRVGVGVSSGSCRGLVGVLSRCFGAAPGAVGGVVARARVHALLVGACFLVRLIVEHGCCCVRTPTARHRSCFRWGGRSCRVAQAARACVPALCGICTRVAVWSLGWPLGHQGTPKTQ